MPDSRGLPTADELRKASQHGIAKGPRIYASPGRDSIVEHFEEIERAIRDGESVRETLTRLKLSVGLFYDLIHESPAHADRYSRACATRADLWHERAEQASAKMLNGGEGLDPNAVRVGLSRIDWITKVLEPKKYGDHRHLAVDVTHRLADELSDAELLAIAAKGKIVDVEYQRVTDETKTKPEDK